MNHFAADRLNSMKPGIPPATDAIAVNIYVEKGYKTAVKTLLNRASGSNQPQNGPPKTAETARTTKRRYLGHLRNTETGSEAAGAAFFPKSLRQRSKEVPSGHSHPQKKRPRTGVSRRMRSPGQ